MSRLMVFGKPADQQKNAPEPTTVSSQDPATGLYTREQVLKLLPPLLEKPTAEGARALLYLRPDRFGEIDERLGPTASDKLLGLIAARLKKHLAAKSLLSRFVGNGFLALVSRPESTDIKALAEEIRESIASELFEVGAVSTSMTVSIGVVVLPPKPQDAEQSISMVQAATRQARQAGGDTVHFEEPSDDEYQRDAETARWVRRTSAALKCDGFRLLYQPIAKLDGSNSFSYDVLLRMIEKNGTEISPGQFMPAAEQAGLMPEIDRWVIKTAFQVAADRHAKGKKTRIFVRLSEDTLRDNRFSGWLGLEALKHRLDLDSVVLQISEQVAERCLPAVRELSRICADIHLKLSLACTGETTRYLTLMRELKLHFVVLEGSCVRSLEPTQLNNLITAARDSSTRVIASRVENAGELSRLYQLGVDYVTGFYVHRPEEGMADNVSLEGNSG
ncbi:MAG: bifunctional diguanylate cyclase/phosphodiesterase [Halieaceae bacterium]|nr:bifunctional diguanylate cyclase/phosphodiesterase [Halieaceae bacterium]